jgi:hypothetical protein
MAQLGRNSYFVTHTHAGVLCKPKPPTRSLRAQAPSFISHSSLGFSHSPGPQSPVPRKSAIKNPTSVSFVALWCNPTSIRRNTIRVLQRRKTKYSMFYRRVRLAGSAIPLSSAIKNRLSPVLAETSVAEKLFSLAIFLELNYTATNKCAANSA